MVAANQFLYTADILLEIAIEHYLSKPLACRYRVFLALQQPFNDILSISLQLIHKHYCF